MVPWNKKGHDFDPHDLFSCSSSTITPKSVSPLPTTESKEHQGEQVGNQQEQMEVPIQEEPFWQEAPVDRPLEHKLTAKIKRPAHVANGILQEERQTQQKLRHKDRFI